MPHLSYFLLFFFFFFSVATPGAVAFPRPALSPPVRSGRVCSVSAASHATRRRRTPSALAHDSMRGSTGRRFPVPRFAGAIARAVALVLCSRFSLWAPFRGWNSGVHVMLTQIEWIESMVDATMMACLADTANAMLMNWALLEAP